ncbi:Protein of unknown function DUF3537 - like 5 [Theobroma cacao]|nr:Protein of unknown function DUF3537 - like 5 [Theobroma cacao]
MEPSANCPACDAGHGNETSYLNVPLLLQPSYSRSKSLLCDELRRFRISLKWCALDHSSCLGKFISYLMFVSLTVFVPIISSLSVQVPSSSLATDTTAFNLLVQFPESGLAFLGFFNLCCFFRRYGLRQLLFLDALQQDTTFVRRGYTRELDKAFRYLACILLPSFFVQVAHKIIFFSTVKISLPYVRSGFPLNSIMFVLVLGSWVYRTGVFLLVCVLFRLTCELQILRFEGLHKMFEGSGSGCDAGEIFQEHVRIRKQLSVTSHRYRFFIIASLVVITVSQFAALLMVLASKSEKSFFNSGDLLVCSAVQQSGFFLCLLGAARMTHRAQGMASVATRWHMSIIISSLAGLGQQQQGKLHNPDTDETPQASISKCNDESDSDSSSDTLIRLSAQHPSNFQTRQALVLYLQHNNRGITLFGYALDRGLLHTLFAFEFSLVMWILSKETPWPNG